MELEVQTTAVSIPWARTTRTATPI
jgi:hypothetical protein